MKLATRRDGSPDGELLVVSTDLSRAVSARSVAGNLLAALESWQSAEPRLRALAEALNRGRVTAHIANGAASVLGSAFALTPC